MLRISFYITSFEGGGAERNTALIASEIARMGHHVLIVVDRDVGPNRELLDHRVEVAVLDKGYFGRVKALRDLLLNWRANALFARLGLCPLIAVASNALGRCSWKTIISYHNPYDSKTYVGVRLTWWLVGALSRITHATFGVSSDIVRQLKRYGACGGRIHLVHNPVDLNWVGGRMHDMPSELKAKRKEFVLSVGRLVPQKGFEDLIEAFAIIANETTVDLIILGEGPLESKLRALIKEKMLDGRVHLVGYVQNPFPYYKEARAFVLASHFEGFGNVIVEALACGAPVIATNCPGGPKDILDNGRYGTLVPVGDTSQLGAAIISAINAPRNEQFNKSRSQEFALTDIANKYIGLID